MALLPLASVHHGSDLSRYLGGVASIFGDLRCPGRCVDRGLPCQFPGTLPEPERAALTHARCSTRRSCRSLLGSWRRTSPKAWLCFRTYGYFARAFSLKRQLLQQSLSRRRLSENSINFTREAPEIQRICRLSFTCVQATCKTQFKRSMIGVQSKSVKLIASGRIQLVAWEVSRIFLRFGISPPAHAAYNRSQLEIGGDLACGDLKIQFRDLPRRRVCSPVCTPEVAIKSTAARKWRVAAQQQGICSTRVLIRSLSSVSTVRRTLTITLRFASRGLLLSTNQSPALHPPCFPPSLSS